MQWMVFTVMVGLQPITHASVAGKTYICIEDSTVEGELIKPERTENERPRFEDRRRNFFAELMSSVIDV